MEGWIPVTPSAKSQINGSTTGQVNNQKCRDKVCLDFEMSPDMPKAKRLKKRSGLKLDETPRKRLKMKRHRPQVFDKDKPKKSPKLKPVSTPKPRTPEGAIPKAYTKRKYVRKCIRKESVRHINLVDEVATTNRSTGHALTTCRQMLDFNQENNDNKDSKQMLDVFRVTSSLDDKGLPPDSGSSLQHFGIGQTYAEVPQTLKTYQRRFWPNDCLKNSRRLGPVFPIISKRKRMKQQRRTDLDKFKLSALTTDCNEKLLPPSEWYELMSNFLPTVRQRRLAIVDPESLGCVYKLRPMVRTRKKRSGQKIRNPILNLPSIPRRTRSETSMRKRRKDFTSLASSVVPQNLSLQDSSHETAKACNDFKDANRKVQDEARSIVREDQMEEFELAKTNPSVPHCENHGLANREVQDEAHSIVREDQMEEHELAKTNPSVPRCENHGLAPDTVISNHRNIYRGRFQREYSLKLIARKFPPNLERNYVLTSRDDTEFMAALMNFNIMKLESLRIGDSSVKNVLKHKMRSPRKVSKIPVNLDEESTNVLKDKMKSPKKKGLKIYVDLDEETLQLWNLDQNGTWNWNKILMLEDGIGNENKLLDTNMEKENKSVGGVENDSAEHWKRVREVFYGRIKLFIVRMHQIQGNRCFSTWKGSVVDSIVGVFLTQNVSDQLSSKAFMTLAARYPPPSVRITGTLESTGSNAPLLGRSANIIIDQPCFLTMEQESNDQILKDGSGSCASNKMISGLIEESIGSNVPEPEHSTAVKTDRPVILPMDQDSCDQIPEVGREATINKMASGLTEDEVIIEEEKAFVKRQELVMSGECPSSNSNTLVGVEPNNGDTSSRSSVKPNNGDNTYSPTLVETNNGNAACSPFEPRSIRKKGKVKGEKEIKIDWDELRRTYKHDRVADEIDSVDWETVRKAPCEDVAEAIKGRGMNNILAGTIQKFLNRVSKDHGSIDLEWLRRVPPNQAKDYLLSFDGIGLKSTECVRLLALHMVAFPVDVNVARILVRLGWVPLKPLPDNLPFHKLNSYPELGSVQKYIWPRLSMLPMWLLYMLHYHLITCGKIFCTLKKPNCIACPMKKDCKHHQSEIAASSNPRLPGPERRPTCSEPIIEFPTSPERVEMSASPAPACRKIQDWDIENVGGNSEDALTTINIACNSLNAMNDSSLATISTRSTESKKIKGLRTEHQVFVLPDSHCLLAEFEKRDPEDTYPYLLAVWTEEDAALTSSQQSKECDGMSCDNSGACSSRGDNIKYENDKLLRGTILIPLRTALKGRFPLNATYFQTNEVFADHKTSVKPILVPKYWLSGLERRTLYCGTHVRSIHKGMSQDEVQRCFWEGYICVRSFRRSNRKPELLSRKFHVCKSRSTAPNAVSDDVDDDEILNN